MSDHPIIFPKWLIITLVTPIIAGALFLMGAFYSTSLSITEWSADCRFVVLLGFVIAWLLSFINISHEYYVRPK